MFYGLSLVKTFSSVPAPDSWSHLLPCTFFLPLTLCSNPGKSLSLDWLFSAFFCPEQEPSVLAGGKIVLPTPDVVLKLPGPKPTQLQWSCLAPCSPEPSQLCPQGTPSCML